MSNNHDKFIQACHYDDMGKPYWKARELHKLFDYTKWRNFNKRIDKAKNDIYFPHGAKKNFVEIKTMRIIGKNNCRMIKDYKLTYDACCVLAEIADVNKPGVQEAKTFFVKGQQPRFAEEKD